MDNIEKKTELKDIYTPLFETIVVEFDVPSKTKGGVILSDKAMQELRKQQSPAMKVIAVSNKVKELGTVKVGDWILPSPDCRFSRVPLLYKNPKEGIQHAQMHISDVLGIIDTDFAQLKPISEKEQIIN